MSAIRTLDPIHGARLGQIGLDLWPIISATLRITVLIAIALLLVLVLLPAALAGAAIEASSAV
jgi:hypothetical protein